MTYRRPKTKLSKDFIILIAVSTKQENSYVDILEIRVVLTVKSGL